ncbi:MAG: polymer-forming cytoskeletal protein [Deltaproteobacteria bacterium]|nr:polymer-forming cytoskeletal protein [Deltaproteobacteria bacterium]
MAIPHARSEAVGEINTLLGRGSEFEGKLTFEGTVRIDGKLSGEVFSDDVLVVGEGAELHAEIDVGEIIIQGLIVGNIRAKRSVEIHAPGRIRGDITTPILQIDKGVVFEGRCSMESVAEVAKRPTGAGTTILAAVAPPSPPASSKDSGQAKDMPSKEPPAAAPKK